MIARDSLLRHILLRLGLGLLTLWLISILVFVAVDRLPGSAAKAVLGQNANPDLVAGLNKEFGLTKPVQLRYLEWLSGMVHGDLGYSMPSHNSVWSLIGDKVRNSATLAGLTVALLVPLSLLLGVAAAIRRDSWLDHLVAGLTLPLFSTPEFVTGTILAVALGVWLGLLPPVSLIDNTHPILDQLNLVILPIMTLLAASVAQTTRMIRAMMIDVFDSSYVEMARLKGVPEGRVLLRHALPNALAPIIQLIAINIAWLAGGVVVVESVFGFPGLGLALTDAVSKRDLSTVEAITMIITTAYVSVNLLADVASILLNPRLRRHA